MKVIKNNRLEINADSYYNKYVTEVRVMKYEKLFTPMKIGSAEIKNRIVMSPMMMGFGQFNGCPTEKMMNYYEERAKGGTGLIITEITRVNDVHGATAFSQLSMSHDYNGEAFREMVDRIHKHGSKIFVQLHHPGRQNLGLLVGTVPLSIAMDKAMPIYEKLLYKIVPAGKVLMKKHIVPRVVAPSVADRSYFADSVMRALSKKEIEKLINQFADAAVRVKNSGADGVELHAAHGYLIQQFLSPNTNRRTDEYGGSLENRMRFLLNIIKGIREKCGDFPLIVRLTVDECYSYIGYPNRGYSLAEGVEMAKRLEQAGIDAIDVSSASYDTFNYWLEPTSFECGWRAYMAKAVKEAVSIPVLAANLIRSPEQAEKQIEDGIQDFISLGRPHIADPHWAEKAESGHPEDIKRCICCLYCFESMQNNAYNGGHGKCSVNPKIGRDNIELVKNGRGRCVVVVGAGPAGLTASEQLADRGFNVVLLEKEERAGGQLVLAAAPPHKEKIAWCIDDLVTACTKKGVEIRYGISATPEIISEYQPYAVIIACGADAVKPRAIKGADGSNVYTSTDILSGNVKLKESRTAVIGSGMTGLETAEKLIDNSNSVAVIEMADTLAPGTWMQHVDDAKMRLKDGDAEFHTGEKLVEIRDNCIITENTATGKREERACDNVVFAVGVKSCNALYEECKGKFDKIYNVGDSRQTGRIADAVNGAFDTALEIN